VLATALDLTSLTVDADSDVLLFITITIHDVKLKRCIDRHIAKLSSFPSVCGEVEDVSILIVLASTDLNLVRARVASIG